MSREPLLSFFSRSGYRLGRGVQLSSFGVCGGLQALYFRADEGGEPSRPCLSPLPRVTYQAVYKPFLYVFRTKLSIFRT
jgi:hypothetical protein